MGKIATSKKIKILLTGANAPGYRHFCEGLAASKKYQVEIIGTEINKFGGNAILNPWLDKLFEIERNDSGDFINTLLSIVEDEGVNFIFRD